MDEPPGGSTETDLESGASSGDANGAENGAKKGADLEALPLRSRERYERLGVHARGGLGTITRARDRELGRALAIKEIQSPERQSLDRFVREARITMRLEHPSIVPVHDAGRWESGEPFYAMKLVAGRTLREVAEGARTLNTRSCGTPCGATFHGDVRAGVCQRVSGGAGRALSCVACLPIAHLATGRGPLRKRDRRSSSSVPAVGGP